MHEDLAEREAGLWRMQGETLLAEIAAPGSTELQVNPLNSLLTEVDPQFVEASDLNNFAMRVFKSEGIWRMHDWQDGLSLGQNIVQEAAAYDEPVQSRDVKEHSLRSLQETREEFIDSAREATQNAGFDFDELAEQNRQAETTHEDPELRVERFRELKENLLLVYREMRTLGYTHQELVD